MSPLKSREMKRADQPALFYRYRILTYRCCQDLYIDDGKIHIFIDVVYILTLVSHYTNSHYMMVFSV